MSITAYTGLPGHGKSYGVVENVILPALKAKRKVYTNIPMVSDKLLTEFNMDVCSFSVDDIKENDDWWFTTFERGSVLVIDECWRLWPSGLKANNARDKDKEFLAEHRHMVGECGNATEVVLVTQDLAQIASFVRLLVDNTFRVKKASSLGLDKNYRVDVFFGAVTGQNPPLSNREREIHGRFKKSVYDCYRSHTKSTVGAGNESRTDGRFNILKGMGIKLGLAFMVLMGTVVFFGAKSVLAYFGSPEDSEVGQLAQPAQSASDPAPVQPAKPVYEPPTRKFLSKVDSIFITGYFKARLATFETVDHFFELNFGDSIVHLNHRELSQLGYDIELINDCLALIKGPDYDGFAGCRSSSESQHFFEQLASAE